jgi:hypothetical protein
MESLTRCGTLNLAIGCRYRAGCGSNLMPGAGLMNWQNLTELMRGFVLAKAVLSRRNYFFMIKIFTSFARHIFMKSPVSWSGL